MKAFAEWLSRTGPSVFIQSHEVWMIPALQSLHIVGIGLAVGSALMMTLRLLGWLDMDETLLQNQRRFGPWLGGALCLLLVSGSLLVIGEPVRELVTFSFWLKMAFVAALTGMAVAFHVSVKHDEGEWERDLMKRRSVRWTAWVTFVMWACIIILGRLIAYDHIWGHLSPATKA
jgi:hypothetical protein